MSRRWKPALVMGALSLVSVRPATGAAQQLTPDVPVESPVIAGAVGDGTTVGLSWYAAKGASGGYEVIRTTDPTAFPTSLGVVPAGTLGYRDTQPLDVPAYYAVVARGSGKTTTRSAWLFFNTPTITNIAASGADVVLKWTTVAPAAPGFEIWRTSNPQQPGVRVGTPQANAVSFVDKNSTSGYYRVIALGAGGIRASSRWYAFNLTKGSALVGSVVPVTALPAQPSVTPGSPVPRGGAGGDPTSGGSTGGGTTSQTNNGTPTNNANQGPMWYLCGSYAGKPVASVTVWTGGATGRLELMCQTPYNNSIVYFAFPTSGASAAEAEHLRSLAEGYALQTVYWESSPRAGLFLVTHARVSNLYVLFDPSDLSGESFGCLNKDCRRIIALRLVPENLSVLLQ